MLKLDKAWWEVGMPAKLIMVMVSTANYNISPVMTDLTAMQWFIRTFELVALWIRNRIPNPNRGPNFQYKEVQTELHLSYLFLVSLLPTVTSLVGPPTSSALQTAGLENPSVKVKPNAEAADGPFAAVEELWAVLLKTMSSCCFLLQWRTAAPRSYSQTWPSQSSTEPCTELRLRCSAIKGKKNVFGLMSSFCNFVLSYFHFDQTVTNSIRWSYTSSNVLNVPRVLVGMSTLPLRGYHG